MKREYPLFDRSRLSLLPLGERVHDLEVSVVSDMVTPLDVHPVFGCVAEKLAGGADQGAARVFMMGAHVIRSGVQRYLIDLMERGAVDHLAMNGAGIIHDFEFALIGKTTESVAKYVAEGQFGLWRETGRINDIVAEGARRDMGLGEAVGRAVFEGDDREFPHKDVSLFAQAYRLGVPVTVHVGIGYDIIHEHPNFDGAAYGKASYIDFLRYAAAMERLEHGVVMNFGSAVMAPEIFLKALAMARNVARQEDRTITNFTTLVCDVADLPTGEVGPEPDKSDPRYYFRPWKTMLSRTVAGAGNGYYFRGTHAQTLPQLHAACLKHGEFQRG